MRFSAASVFLACTIASFGVGDVRSGGGVSAQETGQAAGALRGNRQLQGNGNGNGNGGGNGNGNGNGGGNPFDPPEEEKPTEDNGCVLSGNVIISRKTPKKLQSEGKGPNEIAAIRSQGMSEIAKNKIVYESLGDGDFQVVEVGKGNERAYINSLKNGPHGDAFAYAEPDCIQSLDVTPNDPLWSGSNYQWHHANMQSALAWDLEEGSSAVTVAICDTGVDVGHPDIAANRLPGYHAPSQTWEENGGDISYVHPHGTNCVGCAAAIGNNGLGIAGVGWHFNHRPGRVTDSSGGGASSSALADCARRMCELDDVKVVSVSYSNPDDPARRAAATHCKQYGALMVNSAGNDSRNLSNVGNADNDDLIVVAASDINDNRASFSAFGSWVDVWAPGVSVYTTEPGGWSSGGNGNYRAVSGTSFSGPLTAGLIALIWSKNPGLTPDEVESILKQSTDTNPCTGNPSCPGNLDSYGTPYGRINSYRAMQATASGTPFPTPSPTTAAPTPAPLPIEPTITATFDGICPRCTTVGGTCSSGSLLVSRGSMGTPEPNRGNSMGGDNTMDGCADGNSGSYQNDESVESIEVVAVGGGLLQVGRKAIAKATVHAWSTGSSDTADFYVTDNVGSNPTWAHKGSKKPPGGGMQVLESDEFTLTSTEQAVRVNFRYNGSQSPCSTGGWDDTDDLAFAVADSSGTTSSTTTTSTTTTTTPATTTTTTTTPATTTTTPATTTTTTTTPATTTTTPATTTTTTTTPATTTTTPAATTTTTTTPATTTTTPATTTTTTTTSATTTTTPATTTTTTATTTSTTTTPATTTTTSTTTTPATCTPQFWWIFCISCCN